MANLVSNLATYSSDAFYNNPIAAGVANTIAVTSPIMEVMPFMPIAGKALTVNRQDNDDLSAYVADGATTDLGTDATVGAQVDVDNSTFEIKSIVGQAQVSALSAAAAGANGVDLMAVAVEAKARDIARKVHKNMVTAVTGGFSPLATEVTPTDKTGSSSKLLVLLDELMDEVTSKDGTVDALMMNSTLLNVFRAQARASNAFEYFTLPVSNRNILSYNGVPIFRNDHIANASGDQSVAYALNFEDGGNNGITMIHPNTVPAGVQIEDLGVSERFLANVTRITQHIGMAIMNPTGVKGFTIDASAAA